MLTQDEIIKIVEVTQLYYEQNLTQDEIAKQFGLSRPTISRILKKAQEEKIVQITVIDPFRDYVLLSRRLCDVLGLKNCIVVSGRIIDMKIIRRNIALKAAEYLTNVIKPGYVVGFGWGRTLNEISKYIEPYPINNLIVVPLLGGIGQIDPNLQVHSIIQKICSAFSADCVQYHVPGMVNSEELREQLLKTSNAKMIAKLWKKMNIAVIGIGEPPHSEGSLFQDDISNKESKSLISRGAVGDICMRFFNVKGDPINYLNQYIMSIDLNALKKIPEVIAVAGGIQKADAIIAASRAKYINTLITDELTASKIIKNLDN